MTAPALVLYNFEASTGLEAWESFSPYVVQVARALRLARLPFELRPVSVFEVRKLNALGQLPVLGIGEEKVADSTRILHRIEALAPGSMTGGLDARGQAEAWLWEEFADAALYPYVLAARWADDRGWPVPRQAFFGALPAPARAVVAPMVRRQTVKRLVERDFLRGGLQACYDRMGRVLDALDARAPESGFWMGERPTAADAGLFGQLHALRLPSVEHAAKEVTARKRLNAYLDRVAAATAA
jgi:glutathione S-transferase